MKHVFVINPNAGQKNSTDYIKEELNSKFKDLDYEIYITKSRHDGLRFVKEYLETHDKNETYRFYACGGDGTLYDVVNGSIGFKNAEIACLAFGSGNDFIKNYRASIDDFRNIENAINGKVEPIDIIKINNRYCINITNFGFDGEVTERQIRYRRMKGVSGPMAYKMAAVSSLIFKMSQFLKVVIDGKEVLNEKGLLAIAANGYCYGGGFYCAPNALINDGLIDFILVRKISRLKAASFMSIFRNGKHLDDERLKKKLIYLQGKKASFESVKDVAYAIDGEVFREKRIDIELIPNGLKYVVPANLK